MKRLRQDEIDYLAHPERSTFDYFKAEILDQLPKAAALGIADEELLNYYDNKYHRDPRFVLRLDPNGGNYAELEAWVAETAYQIVGERMGDPKAFREIEKEFTVFRSQSLFALHPYPEAQKIQLLKKIAIQLHMQPTAIDETARLFAVGSSVFAMEHFTQLIESGHLKEFSRQLFRPKEELSRLASRPMLLYPLWDHQKQALEAWLHHGGNGILEMATATGKTLVGLAAAQNLFERHGRVHVLVLAHSRALLDQWRREAIDKLGLVGDPGADYTSPLTYDGKFTVEFNTLQTVYRNPTGCQADLLIVDEVHHGAGLQFRKALTVPCRWKMGLSATVEGAEREQVLDQYLGKTVYTFTLSEARRQGAVPDFRLFVHKTFLDIGEDQEFRDISEHITKLLNYINANHQRRILVLSGHKFSRFENLSDFVKLMRNTRYSEAEVPDEWQKLAGLIYKRRLIIYRSSPKMEQAVALIKQLGNQKKCVVFSMDIETCERMYRMVKGSVNAHRVHSKLSPDDVRRSLNAFRTCTAGVLIAPRMLDEGIDVPDAEIGINVASAKTKLQFVQRMGRILRRRPDKKPVFHHFVALPRSFVTAEDSFTYQNDLAWIHDIALKLDIPIENYEQDDEEIVELEKQSEATVRTYHTARQCIITDDFGTIYIKNIIDSIGDDARERLIALLETTSGVITDEVWITLLRRVYGTECGINISSLRWLLIVAGRDPAALKSLLLMGKKPARPPVQPSMSLQPSAAPAPPAPRTPEDKAEKISGLITTMEEGRTSNEKNRAARALIDIGPPAVEVLTSRLKSSSAGLRIVYILGAIGDRRAVDPLTVCLRGRDPKMRKNAAEALGRIGHPRAQLALTKALRDRDPEVVAAVKQALQDLRAGK